MKTFAAWIVGIAATIAIGVFFNWLGHLVGVQTWIDFGEPILFSGRYYDEEKEGVLSNFGAATTALSAMIGIRLGVAVNKGSLSNHLSRGEVITFNAWFIGIAIWAALAAVLDIAFSGAHSPLAPFVTTAVMAAGAFGLFRWLSSRRDEQLRKLEEANS
ncbi:hypothetical protein D0837_17250 [Bordetella avium]|uniref:hypothetical protein n=1 Tax=Bordetella avium TaxID=521 RepID=UPI000E69D26C|nr:hypothetical protein [Bordetella avium]RIQ79058.1 hypothetical protein D0837_17250 [Bordetella avium]